MSSAETKACFARDFDSFGDAFSSAATALSLRYSMSRVAELGEEAAAPPGAIAEFEAKFFERPFKYGLFRQLRSVNLLRSKQCRKFLRFLHVF